MERKAYLDYLRVIQFDENDLRLDEILLWERDSALDTFIVDPNFTDEMKLMLSTKDTILKYKLYILLFRYVPEFHYYNIFDDDDLGTLVEYSTKLSLTDFTDVIDKVQVDIHDIHAMWEIDEINVCTYQLWLDIYGEYPTPRTHLFREIDGDQK
jgi:hypothetical protein